MTLLYHSILLMHIKTGHSFPYSKSHNADKWQKTFQFSVPETQDLINLSSSFEIFPDRKEIIYAYTTSQIKILLQCNELTVYRVEDNNDTHQYQNRME